MIDVDGSTEPAVEPSTRPAGPPTGPLDRLLAAISPVHVVLAVAVVGVTAATRRSLNDFDSLMHVALGREIVAGHRVNGLGTQWLGVPAPPWRTSQWLSEVLMAYGVDHWGWRVLVLGRLVALAALITLLAVTVLPRRPATITVPVLVLVLISVAGAVLDRPQTFSLVLLVPLGAVCHGLLAEGRPPPYLLVVVGTLVWAQCHGLWVLAPAAFALTAAGGVLDDGLRSPVVRPALAALAASLVGIVNPWGLGSFLLPVQLRAAGPDITEWWHTSLSNSAAVAWALLVALLALAWARSASVPRAEILWGLAWAAFGAMAFRNVAVSALLIAPFVVTAADRVWGAGARRWSRQVGRREGGVLLAIATALVAGGFATAALGMVRTDPLATVPAHRIAAELAESPTPVRVFNSYNASGALVGLATDRVKLAIDGRADLWGSPGIRRHARAQLLDDNWETSIRDFRPDVFVLADNAPLVDMLVRDGDWRIAQRDGDYVLLVPAGPAAGELTVASR